MACPYTKTVDGYEAQFATNHLGHFLLFELLQSTLLSSSTPEFHSRVVSLSSIAHRTCSVFLDDPNFDHTEYTPWKGYGQAKTANIWFSNEVERRFGSQGLHANAVMPGGIVSGLQKFQGDDFVAKFEAPEIKKIMKTAAQGAATSVLAAVAVEYEGVGGKYLENCTTVGPVQKSEPTWEDPGTAAWAFDEAGAKRLWEISEALVAA